MKQSPTIDPLRQKNQLSYLLFPFIVLLMGLGSRWVAQMVAEPNVIYWASYSAISFLLLVFLYKWKQQRRELANELAALKAEKETWLKSKQKMERFHATARHDLQSPLRTITSFTNLYLRKYAHQIDEKGQEYLKFVQEGGRKMQELLDGLSPSEVVTASDYTLKSVASSKVLNSTLVTIQAELEHQNATVEIQDITSFPHLKVHAGQLMQIFQNLIRNSVKFTDSATTPKIQINYEMLGGEHVFTVADNGIGIAEQDLSRIFFPNERTDAAVAYEGTGLGLASCRQIMEQYGGRIWAESVINIGTTIRFAFPDDEKKSPLLSTYRNEKVSRSKVYNGRKSFLQQVSAALF